MCEEKLIASLGEDGEGLARTSPERPSTITELTEHSSTATEVLSRGMKFDKISWEPWHMKMMSKNGHIYFRKALKKTVFLGIIPK